MIARQNNRIAQRRMVRIGPPFKQDVDMKQNGNTEHSERYKRKAPAIQTKYTGNDAAEHGQAA